jgi:hypothetical protein
MKCKECKKEIPEKLKYLAYYCNGEPVYWKLCDECIKKEWLEYKINYELTTVEDLANKYNAKIIVRKF